MTPLIALVLAATQVLDPPPRFETLPNGLRIGVLEDRTLPLVSVQLWLRGGSALDPPSTPGLCQLTRSALVARAGLPQRFTAAGLPLNSQTLRDASNIATIAPSPWLDFVLNIYRDTLAPRELTAGDLETAMPPVAQLRANPIERELLATLFEKHAYDEPPDLLGDALRHVTPETANQFAADWFSPAQTTILIIGDVSAIGAIESARQAFADLPHRAAPLPPWPEPLEPQALTLHADDADAYDVLWLTDSYASLSNAALDVLMQRLCNPVDGRLAGRLDELGCPPPVWSRWAGKHAGALRLSLSASESPDSRPAGPILRDMLNAVLEKAAAERATPHQLIRARNLALADLLERRASLAVRALRLGEMERVGGDLLLCEFERPRLTNISVDQLRIAARELLDTRRVERFAPPGAAATERPPPDRRPRLAPELELPQPPWIDPAQLLDARATGTADSPPPAPPPIDFEALTLPAVSSRTLDATALQVCQLPTEWAVVRLRTRGPTEPGLGRKRPPAGVVEYATMHGIRMRLQPAAEHDEVALAGPAELWPQLLELAQHLAPAVSLSRGDARRQPPGVRRHLTIVVPASLDEVAALWIDLGTEPAPPDLIHSLNRPWPQRPPRLIGHSAATRPASPELPPVAEIPLPGFAPNASDEIAAALLIRLLGLPHNPLADGDAAPNTWRWQLVDHPQIALRATQPAGASQRPAALAALRTQLAAIRAGQIDEKILSAALDRARVDLLLRLDGPEAIAAAITRLDGDPWEAIRSPRTPRALLERIRSPGWLGELRD